MFARHPFIIEQKVYRSRAKRKKHGLKDGILEFKKGDMERFASKCVKHILEYSHTLPETRKEIQIPSSADLKKNFKECMVCLNSIVHSFKHVKGHLILNFGKCTSLSVSFLVILRTIIEELELFSKKVSLSRYKKTPKHIKLRESKSDMVNRHLASMGFGSFSVNEEEQREYLHLGLLRGHSRNYRENKKAVVSQKITQFVEDTTERFNFGFDERGQNYMQGMVGEILSNAEDHSLKKSEWYVDGISFLHEEPGNQVIEFNLVILNYGDSMFDGFERTKEKNIEMYSKLESLYQKHSRLFTSFKSFTKESLFTLYMLNEGISRLKYLEPSRGNGTMKFLKSFIDLGQFCNMDKRFNPELSIISGHTILTCNENYAPFEEGNHYKLTLNTEQSLEYLPDTSALKFDSRALFPGTILECKIFLNKQDLEKRVA